MKTVILILSTFVSSAAMAETPSQSIRQTIIKQTVNDVLVSAIIAKSTESKGVTDKAEDIFSLKDNSINCDDNPLEYGRKLTDLCSYIVQGSYGWYADPVLSIRVYGYVNKKDSNQVRILKTVVETPFATGLE